MAVRKIWYLCVHAVSVS